MHCKQDWRPLCLLFCSPPPPALSPKDHSFLFLFLFPMSEDCKATSFLLSSRWGLLSMRGRTKASPFFLLPFRRGRLLRRLAAAASVFPLFSLPRRRRDVGPFFPPPPDRSPRGRSVGSFPPLFFFSLLLFQGMGGCGLPFFFFPSGRNCGSFNRMASPFSPPSPCLEGRGRI